MGMVHFAILTMALVSVVLSMIAVSRDAPFNWQFTIPASFAAHGDPQFEMVFDYDAQLGQAHSPSIVLNDDGFSILWFEGSEEAQADVDIFHSRFRLMSGKWMSGVPERLVTRGGLGPAMEPSQLVVTLGNTIENEGMPGHLYSTVVSVGGWAMASIADVEMGSNGHTYARKLNLSPLLNRSHLVKSPMIAYEDGSYALPAYFEMGAMHGAFVRLNARGRVRDVRRMVGKDVQPIQPMVVPLDASRAVAFLRNFDTTRQKLLISHTEDGGQNWSEVVETEIENPSSPVAALPLGDGRILMAVNDNAERADVLHLSLSADGGESWRVLHSFEGGEGALRYPMLRRLNSGEIVLSYSHSTKGGVRAHVMNDAWIEAR